MATDLSRLEATWAPRMLSVLRIMTGLLFLEHGTQKLLNFPARVGGAPMPDLASLVGIQGLLELVGGLLIIFGIFTRPVAFLLAGNMAVAYFMVHSPRGLFPISMGGNGEHGNEMGVFSALYNARRESNLAFRVGEHLRIGLEAAIFHAT